MMEIAEAFCNPFAKARFRLFWGITAIDPKLPLAKGG